MACLEACRPVNGVWACGRAEVAASGAAEAGDPGRQLALGRMVQAALLAGVPFGAAAIAMVVRK